MTPLYNAQGFLEDTSISLSSRRDKPIANSQAWGLSAYEWHQLEVHAKYEGSGIRRVAPECPVYNCHGLTFGSRRTGVYEDNSQIFAILDDDGYVELNPREADTGDIVLYFDPEGLLSHSGIVISRGSEELGLPMIWSKWGKGYEMVHFVNRCPYSAENVKYYRLKIWKPEHRFKTL
jgi:hypothetical protein